MKISLFTHHFLPKYVAGGEQYAYRIAQELQRQGHDVEIVCIESIQDGTLMPAEVVDSYHGLTVYRLYMNLGHAPNPTEWSFRNPQLGYWATDYLLRARPDMVHINGGYLISGSVIESAQRLGIPVAVTLHDYWFVCPRITLLRPNGQICTTPVRPEHCVWCGLLQKRRFRLPDSKLNGQLGELVTRLMQVPAFSQGIGLEQEITLQAQRRAYLKNILETVDLVLTPSQFLEQKLLEYGIYPRQLVHLPFGLDFDSYPPQPAKREHVSPLLRIGYMGQINASKGVHLLIQAFRRLRYPAGSCSLVIYGNLNSRDPYYRRLRRLARGNKDITFAGPYPNSRAADIYAEVDVVVVPSQWYENRPTVIVEAMAAGIPVVGARIGGIAELIHDDQDGLLFYLGDADSLRQQLQRLISEPGLLPRLRQNILPVPNVRQEVTTLLGYYQSVLDSQRIAIDLSIRKTVTATQ